MSAERNYGLGLMAVDWEDRIDYDRMRREREERARATLQESDIDLLILIREENMRYLTAYRTLGRSFTSFSRGVFVMPKSADPIFYCFDHDFVAHKMPWVRGWLPETFVPSIGIGSVGGAKALLQDVRERLPRVGVRLERIGVDAWTSGLFEAMPQVFPGAEFVDGQHLLSRATRVKTEQEIRCIENACAITVAGMEAARDALKPGSKECEIQAQSFLAMFSLGCEWTKTSGTVSSQTAPFRNFTTDRITQNGDVVIVDIGARFNGYFAGLARSWICGQASSSLQGLKELHRKAYCALREAEEACRPDATTRDIILAAKKHVPADSLGHSIGISAIEIPLLGTFPGGNFQPGEASQLTPGMVLYLEPYIGQPGIGGIKLGDTVLITEEGHRILSEYPFDPNLFSS